MGMGMGIQREVGGHSGPSTHAQRPGLEAAQDKLGQASRRRRAVGRAGHLGKSGGAGQRRRRASVSRAV